MSDIQLYNEVRAFPISKMDIAVTSVELVSHVIDSNQELEFAERIAAMEAFIESVKSNPRWRNAVRDKCGKGVVSKNNTKIEPIEAGTKYDYSSDDQWKNLDNQIVPLRDRQKRREQFLRGIPAGKQLIDNDTGEIMATGPTKTSVSTYKVTLAK